MDALVFNPGKPVDLRCLDAAESSEVVRVMRTANVEILQVLVRAGEDIPTHVPQGEVILHCLVGRVDLVTCDEVRELRAGQMLHLQGNRPFSIKACESSSLLMTTLEPQTGGAISLIGEVPGRPR